MSRVARKQQEARRRLVAAAMELIADKGVEGLRIREIADAADVGFGSFYRHFATKEELVEAVVADYIGSLTDGIIERASTYDDPAQIAAVAHRLFIRLATDNPRLAWLIVRLDRGDALLEIASIPRFGAVLQRGVATGRFKGIDIELTVSFIVGATISVMRGILEGRLGPDADIQAARTLLRACGIDDEQAAELASRPLEPPAAQ